MSHKSQVASHKLQVAGHESKVKSQKSRVKLLAFNFTLLTVILLTSSAFSQNKVDTLHTDTIKTLHADTVKPKAKVHSPVRASVMSAIIPGSGQIYNKKYWKTPLILGGLGTMGYFIQTNHALYLEHKKAYIARVLGEPVDPKFDSYNAVALNELQEYYQKNMEWSIVGALAVYLINIIDASVDAHLYTFDVSDDLSFRVQPAILPANQSFQTMRFQLKMSLNF